MSTNNPMTEGEALAVLRELRDTGDVSDWQAMESALTMAVNRLTAHTAASGGEACPKCKGAGEYEGFARHASGDPQDEYAATVQCEPCEGTGEVAAPPSASVGVEAMRRAVEEIESGDFGGGVSDACLSAMKAALTQQPAQAAPGWKLVPVEPTMEMRSGTGIHHVHAENIWRAMLAAAPTPPGDDAAGGGS